MVLARNSHTATLLADGRVLVTGGEPGRYAELYDPKTNKWSLSGPMMHARTYHSATLLATGQVLVAGGYGFNGDETHLQSAELFDTATNTWSATGALREGRAFPTATLLANGQVLVTGGAVDNEFLRTAELYDPMTATWSSAGSMRDARIDHSATLLRSGLVLVAGGGSRTSVEPAEGTL
jgi:hypothetical protein